VKRAKDRERMKMIVRKYMRPAHPCDELLRLPTSSAAALWMALPEDTGMCYSFI
jgi:hypothetical protein